MEELFLVRPALEHEKQYGEMIDQWKDVARD
jgi:predicted acetyltransferase